MRLLPALFLLLLTALLVLSWHGLAVLYHTETQGLRRMDVKASPPMLWIEVHDVSPAYGTAELEEITGVIDRHGKAVDRVVLFVIPNHAGATPLSSYPGFARELKDLAGRGYIIGMHGYEHSGDLRTPEFMVNRSRAIELVEKGVEEFRRAGLPEPTCFAPPSWRASEEAARYLRSVFQHTYYLLYIDTGNATLPYRSHEYTWYRLNMGGLRAAERDYDSSKGIFRLTVHMEAVNTEENLLFLDRFLSYVEGRKDEAAQR